MRLIDADELERRIREAEKIFYDSEDVGIAIDCIDATKTISEWHYPSRGELPPTNIEVLLCLQTEKGQECIVGKRAANNDMLEGGGYCWCWFDFGRMGFIEFVDERESIEVVAWQYIVPPKEQICEK